MSALHRHISDSPILNLFYTWALKSVMSSSQPDQNDLLWPYRWVKNWYSLATLPGVWRNGVSVGTGRPRVSILWLGEVVGSATSTSVGQHVHLSEQIRPWDVAGTLSDYPTNQPLPALRLLWWLPGTSRPSHSRTVGGQIDWMALKVSRATLGRLLRDGTGRVWAFPSATMPSWTETETYTLARSLVLSHTRTHARAHAYTHTHARTRARSLFLCLSVCLSVCLSLSLSLSFYLSLPPLSLPLSLSLPPPPPLSPYLEKKAHGRGLRDGRVLSNGREADWRVGLLPCQSTPHLPRLVPLRDEGCTWWQPHALYWFRVCAVDENRLVGLVVRRPPRERKIPGSNPACAGIFFGVESYQWLKNSHSSDYPARRLVL